MKNEVDNPQRLYVQSCSSRLDAQWVVGFTDGEGCFHVGVNSHPDMTAGFQVLPEFTIVQHKRDIKLLYAIKKFFNCGVVRVNHGDRMCYRVRDIKHLSEIIVPFFTKNPLRSIKNVDFIRFRRVVELIKNSEHLNPEGIEKIRAITSLMNRGKER